MALNIKSKEVVKLAEEIGRRTGVSKAETIRQPLTEKRDRLMEERTRKSQEFHPWIEEEVWPNIRPRMLGRRLTKEERAANLGYGPNGV